MFSLSPFQHPSIAFEIRDRPSAASLEARVHELEVELQRVTRERDILKKALVIFGRQE